MFSPMRYSDRFFKRMRYRVRGWSTALTIGQSLQDHSVSTFPRAKPKVDVCANSRSTNAGKAWGFAGVRIGWVVTRNRQLRDTIIALRHWTLQSVSTVDDIIAREVLSERCCNRVVSKNLANARQNSEQLRSFVQTHKDSVSCVIPTGGSTAFVKFSDPKSGKPVDDLEFCRKLKEDAGLLLSPGSLCFGMARDGDFRGYVRMHTTAAPEKFKRGLDDLAKLLTTKEFANLAV